MDSNAKKDSEAPDWRPENAGKEFAVSIRRGQEPSSAKKTVFPTARALTVEEYAEGVLKCERAVLARAITLVESDAVAHLDKGQELLARLAPHTGRAIRIGITGVPGAGKSTFIESFGTVLCEMGKRVAVLAVDPSSTVSKGSILGDKTRMEKLSRHPNAYIRPSPSGGALGGVARKTRESMLICEAAGFDVILVETVGVGQSETSVRSMVDFFMLLSVTGTGDDLQGIKRGSLELSDAIVITKADGDNRLKAEVTCRMMTESLHYLAPSTPGWLSRATFCSSLTGEGVKEVWDMVWEFWELLSGKGTIEERRRMQNLVWARSMLEQELLKRFYEKAEVMARIQEWEKDILDGKVPVTAAVRSLLEMADQ